MNESTEIQYSPDGNWWWDGQQWLPVTNSTRAQAPMSARGWFPSLAVAGGALLLIVGGWMAYHATSMPINALQQLAVELLGLGIVASALCLIVFGGVKLMRRQ